MDYNVRFVPGTQGRTVVGTVVDPVVRQIPVQPFSPEFKQYVSSLNLDYINIGLNDIRNSLYFEYRPNALIQSVNKFANNDPNGRLQILLDINRELPTVNYQLYVPTPVNRNFNIPKVTVNAPDLHAVKARSNKFWSVTAQLDFWANHFGYPEEQSSSNTNMGKMSYMLLMLTTPQFILDLLARMRLPSELYNAVSKTEIGLTFALLTGKVIEPMYDPTANRQIWDVISQLSISEIQSIESFYDMLEDHLPGLLNPNVYSPLLYISDPRILLLVPYVSLETYYISHNPDYKLPDHTKALFDQYQTRPNFYEDIGLNPEYYSIQGPSIRISDVVGYILHKKLGIVRPPLVYSVPSFERHHEIDEALKWYNDDEVMNFYFPYYLSRKRRGLNVFFNQTRRGLTNTVANKYTETSFGWSIERDKNELECTNGDNVSVMYGGRRSEEIQDITNEDLIWNPVLSYGIDLGEGKHRCFRTVELLEIFTDTLDNPDGPDFPDPDYIIPGPGRPHIIDPLTGRRLLRTFDFRQMHGLVTILTNHVGVRGRIINGEPSPASQLVDVINRILLIRFPDEMRNANARRTTQVTEVEIAMGIRPEWKNDVLIFFGWLFMFSMWMRFWKGPGYPFNISKVSGSPDKCPPIQRDEHIIIELSVYGNMITDLENKNAELANFIKNLPIFNYDWETRRVGHGGTKISTVIDSIQNEKYCMGFAGDVLIAVAYVYLVRIMEIPEDRMDDFITYVLTLLRPREREVIETRKRVLQSTKITDGTHRLWVNQGLETVNTHELLLRVGDPGFYLPNIDFDKVGYNMHV